MAVSGYSFADCRFVRNRRGIKFISNPFGNPISLNYSLFAIHLSAIFVWLWMMGMIFTTKLLDGLDGLCGGIA